MVRTQLAIALLELAIGGAPALEEPFAPRAAVPKVGKLVDRPAGGTN